MKLFITLLALIATAAGDVSHLNNMYLPPVRVGAAGGDSFGVSVGGSFGAGASGDGADGGEVSYAAQQSLEYTQQVEEVPAAADADSYSPADAASEPEQEVNVPAPIGGDPVTFGNIEPEPSSVDVQSAPAVGSASQYVGQDDGPAPVDADASQFVSQNYEADNSIAADSYGNTIGGQDTVANGPAAQVPAIRAPLPAASAQDSVAQYVSGSNNGGIDTKYGSNGGYIY